MAITAITMPKWGLTMEQAVFIAWTVTLGETVTVGDKIAGIAGDKLEGELEAPATGVVRHLNAEAGETYQVGTLLGVIADADTPDAEIDAFVAGRS